MQIFSIPYTHTTCSVCVISLCFILWIYILQAADEALIQGSIEETTLGIYILKQRDASDKPDDIGIVLEGQIVLQELDNVALAAAMLFGLMYALNLNYPPELKYTFEVLQKVVMELEGNTLSKKAQVLKNRLYQWTLVFWSESLNRG